MTKKIQTVVVGESFGDANDPMYPCTITFADNTQGHCYAKSDPPWFKAGDDVEVIDKGKMTTRAPHIPEISVKRDGAQAGGGSYGGGGGGYKGGSGSKGNVASFALSYSKDIVCALIKAGKIVDADVALSATENGFKKLLPLLESAPAEQPATPSAPPADPLWIMVEQAIKANGLAEVCKSLGMSKRSLKEEWNKCGGNSANFADALRQEASGADSQLPDDDDDVPF